MTGRQRIYWFFIAVAVAALLVTLGLSYLVTEPEHVLPEIGGDGCKNSFTYLYHSMYGSGYWFEGMNYPYGEHIVFTDGVPVLSVLFASLGNVSADTALTTLWWAIGLSYVLSILYLYKALLRLAVPPVWAIAGACLIGMLTPQWIRLRGHYALSFVSFVPMLLYWTLAWYQERKLKYWVYVAILGFLFSFIHPYYAGVVLVWAGAFAGGYVLFERGKVAEKVKAMLPVLSAATAVPVLVMLVMKVTDPIKDRPATPYASAEGFSTPSRIISSAFSPFWKVVSDKGWLHNVADGGEGFGYIGLVVIAVLVIALPVFYLRRRREPQHRASFLTLIAMFMAFGILLFSMGVPMRWHIPGLMKVLFVFKQIRTIGRFAWLFYYIVGVYSVVTIYEWFKALVSTGKRGIAVGLLSLALAVWSVEVYGYIQAMRKVADQGRYNYEVIFSTREQNWKQFLAEHGKRPEDFQALLLLKYYNVGTEKLWIGDPGWLMTLGAKASLQLKLPIVDAMMSRSSIQRAKDLAKTVAGPYAEKPLLQLIRSDKPLLLLNYDINALSPDEAYLLKASDYLGEYSQCKVYACYPQRIAANDRANVDSVMKVAELLAPGADTCLGDCGTWYAQHFNESPSMPSGELSGIPCISSYDSILATIPMAALQDSTIYEFSCWFKLEYKDHRSPDVVLQMNGANGKPISEITVKTNQSVDSRGDWYRASAYFYMPAACRQVQCRVINELAPAYIAMDEVLLRPAGATIISKVDRGIMANGHLLIQGRK
ncbi:MAG: hypothetical protein KF744_13690 [Taibaiella sp.]|nr:hypothetical protein [Taibaiella sp.]